MGARTIWGFSLIGSSCLIVPLLEMGGFFEAEKYAVGAMFF